MSTLSTHVLDTMHGKGAPNMLITLSHEGEVLFIGRTNAEGRCPAIGELTLAQGSYRLSFDVATYYRALGMALLDPPFLGEVVIEFGMADESADAGGHYHVPLLVSPYGYTTYRGS